ncbi:MAG: proton-conducting transporter membrane subunit, partial [Candidatus Omnitrophota bacterium]|nr:proton-conducting transporter membrane subunit [Candidatus Omnitrophota bacterium]
MSNPVLLIGVTFLASLICAFIPRMVRPLFALAVSLFALVASYYLFTIKTATWDLFGLERALRIDNLSAFVLLFISFFGSLIILYSIGFLKGKNDIDSYNLYYPYILATIAASIGTVLSNNLLIFISFWGFLGLTLYLLIAIEGEKAKAAAKKTFIIIGGTDAFMILGVAIIWKLTGTMNMDEAVIPLTSGLAIFSFILLALGTFAKAGAVPLHTWIPEASEVAPVPVAALLITAFDKLLGIYFLARLTLSLFAVEVNSGISQFLLVIGAVTIVSAGMMAIVQNNMKQLMAYSSVSQVGYIVLGLGTANPIGIAGGLFHMLNHAIYKSTLFLTAGAVEKKTGTTDLDSLGG